MNVIDALSTVSMSITNDNDGIHSRSLYLSSIAYQFKPDHCHVSLSILCSNLLLRSCVLLIYISDQSPCPPPFYFSVIIACSCCCIIAFACLFRFLLHVWILLQLLVCSVDWKLPVQVHTVYPFNDTKSNYFVQW